jgi:hypothetical protein
MGPEALAHIDIPKLARKITRDGDMSPEVLLDEDEVAQKLQAQQQQQFLQQAQQAIADQDPTQTIPPMAPPAVE